jgi:hypothetical protein
MTGCTGTVHYVIIHVIITTWIWLIYAYGAIKMTILLTIKSVETHNVHQKQGTFIVSIFL